MGRYLFTSESVTEGHPDKLCDAISDSVLDAVLSADPKGRVACETMVKTGYAIVAGEISTRATLDYPKIIRKAIVDIGYTDGSHGIDGNSCAILTAIEQQSPDIAQGVDVETSLSKDQGAGDQGLPPPRQPHPVVRDQRRAAGDERQRQRRLPAARGAENQYPPAGEGHRRAMQIRRGPFLVHRPSRLFSACSRKCESNRNPTPTVCDTEAARFARRHAD